MTEVSLDPDPSWGLAVGLGPTTGEGGRLKGAPKMVNGCFSTNLEVVPTDSPHLSMLQLCTRSQDENGSHVWRTVWI